MQKFFFILFLFVCLNIYSFTLRRVLIEGNKQITNKEIESKLSIKSGDFIQVSDLPVLGENLANIYTANNYFNVIIDFPQMVPVNKYEVDLYLNIREDEKIKIEKIIISGNRYFSTSKILKLTFFDNIKYLDFNSINDFMETIAQLYQRRGYLFVKVVLEKITNYPDYCLYLKIEEGEKCRFTEFSFLGNKYTKKKSLIKISGLNSVKNYNLDVFKEVKKRIQDKVYINKCEIIPINENKLQIKITEGKMTKISFLGGYDNSITGKTIDKFVWDLDLVFFNLYGTDRSLELYFDSFNNNKQVKMIYKESGPLNIPLSGEIGLERTEQDTTQIKSSINSEIFYYTHKNKYGIILGFEYMFPGSGFPKIYPKTTDKKMGFFWEYSSLDNSINSTKGYYIKSKFYKIFRDEGVLLGVNDKRKKYDSNFVEIELENYIKIFERQVYFQSYNVAFSTNLDLDKKYNLGGFTTLRGFNENQFSGNRIFWINQEWRYLLSLNTRAFLFLDYGYVEYKNLDVTKSLTDLVGFGVGLRLETKLGLFGLDYALNYVNGKVKNPTEGIIHFGIVTSF